jgi:hypothetical protein
MKKKVREETGYPIAKERQIKFMKKGFDMGTRGKISISREELHESDKLFGAIRLSDWG